MLRLIRYGKPYLFVLAAAIVLLFGQAACDLALPDYMGDMVDKGIAAGNSSYILGIGLKMLGITLAGMICSITVAFLSAKIAAGLCRNLRREIFARVGRFSNAEFDQFSTSSLITRTTNDITQIQMMMIMLIRMVFYAPILAVGGFLRALSTDKSMSWIILIAVVLLVCIVLFMMLVAMPKFKVIQTLIDKLSQVVREGLDGMLVVRAFNTQTFEERRFDQVNDDLTATNLFINRLMAGMMPMMMLIMNLVTVLIVWVGASQVASFKMEVGDMMAYMQYVMQIIMAFLMMSMMFIMIPRASVSANRIADVLETEESIRDGEGERFPEGTAKGLIQFENVSFAYPGAEEDVLHDIDFTARPGQMTAFIGSTGSGKSTIMNLIPRFYDVSGGQITIDGMDIRKLKLHVLREQIGYVPQKAVLFSGTIRSNLAYADENADQATLEKAAEIAQAAEFIHARPSGFEAEIAQGAANLSGGQKQRLSIGRALLKRPQIYIFDDSFSALDFKTDAKLRKALKEETGGSTVLLVTQRVSTAMAADQIVVLDKGQIVGQGSHKELLASCEVYEEIALSQLSKEDME